MMRRVFMFFLQRLLPPVLVFAVVAAGMELLIRRLHIASYTLPLPSEVLTTLIEQRQDLLAATWTTSKAAGIGFGCSAVIGVTVAIILSASVWVRRAFYPYALFFQTVPIVAIAPMLVVWFDAGIRSVSISAFIVSVFPVITNTLSGLLGLIRHWWICFSFMARGRFQRLWKLRLPHALPSIVSGLRVAAGLAVIGTIVGEFLVGELGDDEGLGVKIESARHYFHLDVMFASILLSSLLGLVLFAAVNLFGHLTLRRWHASEK